MARRVKLSSRLNRELLCDMVLRTFGSTRWTQDSPIVPDVWIKYIEQEWAVAFARISSDASPEREVDLLLTPWRGSIPGQIARRIRVTLGNARVDVAPSSTRVAARLTFAQMFWAVLPLTGWWQSWFSRFSDRYADEHPGEPFDLSDLVYRPRWWSVPRQEQREMALKEAIHLEWLRLEVLIGFIVLIGEAETEKDLADVIRLAPTLIGGDQLPAEDAGPVLVDAFARMLVSAPPPVPDPPTIGDAITMTESQPLTERIWFVNLNRGASTTMFDSRKTVKADAAQRVFDTGGRGMTIAVLDVGIQATHPGFFDRGDERVRKRFSDRREAEAKAIREALAAERAAAAASDPDQAEAEAIADSAPVLADDIELDETALFEPHEWGWSSRVRATYDFTLLRGLMSGTANGTLEAHHIKPWRTTLRESEIQTALQHLQIRAASGRGIDWALVEPLIRIPHNEHYEEAPPLPSDHGTHVAGIIAADLPKPPEFERPLKGICPEATLYDIRVFDSDLVSTEYTIVSAIEFIGWLNRNRSEPVIHAVNLSLALAHQVDSFACGRTPICDACNQLVGAGTVVVAAAGNTGFENQDKQSLGNGFRTVSITDPGNADEVITVGSTHRRDPHAYGVSYFSSRGPTADGRRKPDLLAPGEKINSTVREGQVKPLDGTSMAAPHVTGAAALLMARYPELIGQPAKIKRVLMESATDLGRERSFQGAGLLDILRALQSI